MAFPGFDTASYPGDEVMDKWFGNPYVFTGYYLEAPCHNANSFKPWQGHMADLKQIGWGFVVVYVGRQATGCGSSMLSRAQGLSDAVDAIGKAQIDSMPNSTTLFLDIEVMPSVSPAMIDYMQGWIAGILHDGKYAPGIYAAYKNATTLFDAAQQEFASQGLPNGAPAFWIVREPGGSVFDVNTSSPQDLANFSTTPISFANVWQGKLDIDSETHNGIEFGPVDQNVADTSNPSGA